MATYYRSDANKSSVAKPKSSKVVSNKNLTPSSNLTQASNLRPVSTLTEVWNRAPESTTAQASNIPGQISNI